MGRDPSPILDRYPPKDPQLAPRAPPPKMASPPPGPGAAPAPVSPDAPGTAAPPLLGPLLTLERPFDPDDFAQQLGETVIEVKVPRDQLAEVLRRVAEFMGFGIYVYEIAVRPAPAEMLRDFIVTLRRVDYQAAQQTWGAFEEKGRSESPFGPEGRR